MERILFSALIVMAVPTVSFSNSSADNEIISYIESGAYAKYLSAPYHARAVNYYNAFNVYESRNHDFRNPLYFSTSRGDDGKTKIYRATKLFIPLYRGKNLWRHLEVVEGFEVGPDGSTEEEGYSTFSYLGGDITTGLSPVVFYERHPGDAAGEIRPRGIEESMLRIEADSDGGRDSPVKPVIPSHLESHVKNGLVIQHFLDGVWGVFRPDFSYDDMLYVEYRGRRHRVLYTLDPAYDFGGDYFKKWFLGFRVNGGFIDLIPADHARIENGHIDYQ